jgi:hypothetical protein
MGQILKKQSLHSIFLVERGGNKESGGGGQQL